MANFREEWKRNPEFISDDIGPLRAASSYESAHLGGKRDSQIYGGLGTTEGLAARPSRNGIDHLHLEFRRLGFSLPQQNVKNRGNDITRKCKIGSHEKCFGCLCPCHRSKQ